MPDTVLNTQQITKRFGGVTALDGVSIDLRESEVMALVGDNGAGKSTLIKIISGAYGPDEGNVFVRGERVHLTNPKDAWDLGIATIYQELALANKMNVPDNIFLGREMTRSFLGIDILDRGRMRKRAEDLLDRLDVHIPDLDNWVAHLSGGQRQGIAIARALNLDAGIIIMDEPTAALAVAEVRKVLDFIRRLRDEGKSVIVISHNIQDVFAVSDRITVLRQGKVAGVRDAADAEPDEIISLITGAYEVKKPNGGADRGGSSARDRSGSGSGSTGGAGSRGGTVM